MSEISITNRTLGALQPQPEPYFLRDNNPKGFAVKVNPSGKITFIVEVWPKGEAKRKTLGTYLSFRGQRPGQNWRVSEPFAGIWGQLSTPGEGLASSLRMESGEGTTRQKNAAFQLLERIKRR